MNTYSPSQVWIRGTIYLAISLSTEALSILSGETVIDPRIAGLKIFLSGCLTLRAYLDKTPSQTEPTPQEPSHDQDS